MQHGDFTHVEIPADDTERAKRFYTELFGWTFPPEMPGFEGYHMFMTPAGQEGVGGAIGKRGEMAPERMLAYIHVDSIDQTLRRVAELGGSVSRDKQQVGEMGWYAVLTDSEGNSIGLWESATGGAGG